MNLNNKWMDEPDFIRAVKRRAAHITMKCRQSDKRRRR